MRKTLLLSIFFITSSLLQAQPSQPLNENEPAIINGIECTWRINQESTKKSGDNEYSRYVVEFYAVNKSDCNKYIPYQNDPSLSDNSADNLITTFTIRNANGKRFTSTSARLYAKPWWVRVKVAERNSEGKDVVRLRDMQAGFVFRRGEQLRAQATVLVPMGEKPNIEVLIPYTLSNNF